MDRRAFLVAACAGLASAACSRKEGVPGVLRLGFLARLTDAPVMAALASGRLAAALPGLRIETRTFRAGPRVTEALLGGAIDVGTTGPAPVLAAHVRHAGAPLAVVSGLASGGASLVTLPSIRGPADLHGRRLVTPQLGSTTDVALRKWLHGQGLMTADRGGDVQVDALTSANAFAELARGNVVGAWLQEPWATRVVHELGGRRLDERTLWPGGRFPAALVVARRDFLRARPADVARVVTALGAEIDRASADPVTLREGTAAELLRLARVKLRPSVLTEALSHLDFTRDPQPLALATLAADVAALGYAPSASIAGLVT